MNMSFRPVRTALLALLTAGLLGTAMTSCGSLNPNPGGQIQPLPSDPAQPGGYLDVNGAHLAYTSVGQGTPILLIHGYPLSGELFARNRDTLAAAGYRVITIDQRGYGHSTAPASDPGSIGTYAADALAVLDQLGIQKAIIGGMSMGGPVVFEMYRRAPQRFLGMLLIDTVAAPAPPSEAGLWRGTAEQAQTQGVSSLVPGLIKNMLTGQTRVNNTANEVTYLSSIINQASLAGAVAGAQALANRPDSRPTLGTITVPTLVIVGLEDTIYPVMISQAMQQAIPNARLAILPGAAHAAILENAPAANAAILNWARANNLR
ncbi:alpha/beta hydrolase [Deinococcus aluminii]|uniref:Aminoacrylate hydrolase RutD n=1 Tax=Deinococcus aluminii TaxID=1656885 RepID=A0ABP9XGV2_9DEIO